MTPEQKQHAMEILDKLGLCTCGTSAHWMAVLRLLEIAEENGVYSGDYADFAQSAITGDVGGFASGAESDEIWIEFGAKVLDTWGLIEHGAVIDYAWLTKEGKLVLEFLREYGTDERRWPERAE